MYVIYAILKIQAISYGNFSGMKFVENFLPRLSFDQANLLPVKSRHMNERNRAGR